MSFANFDVEAQKPLHQPSNDLDDLVSNTSSQLQSFGHLVSQLDQQRKQIGTRRDTQELRNAIDEMAAKTATLVPKIELLVHDLSSRINNSKDQTVTERQVVIKERLAKEFTQLNQQFRESYRVYKESKQQNPIRTSIPDENTPLLETPNQQEQQLVQDEIDASELQYHVQLTEERNREITKVSQGIQEVNAIFKDLSELVNQQGEQIDTIEDNIMQLGQNARSADKELFKANEYQKKKGRWSCILLVALSIFVLVVVLAVVS